MTPDELRQIREEIRKDLTEEQDGSFLRKFMSAQPKLNGKAMSMILGWILAINGAGLAGTAMYVKYAVDTAINSSSENKAQINANTIVLHSLAEIVARLDERTRKDGR